MKFMQILLLELKLIYILKDESGKIQFKVLLGLVNLYLKGDIDLAIKDFQDYLKDVQAKGISDGINEVVLVVSGTTRYTRLPAAYRFHFSPDD